MLPNTIKGDIVRFKILKYFSDGKVHSFKEVARVLGSSPSGLGSHINYLLRRKYLEIVETRRGGRKYRITKNGLMFLEYLEEKFKFLKWISPKTRGRELTKALEEVLEPA